MKYYKPIAQEETLGHSPLSPSTSGERDQVDLNLFSVAVFWSLWVRYWKLILATALVLGVVSYAAGRYLQVHQPSYVSSVELNVLPSGAELSFASIVVGGLRAEQNRALVRTTIEAMNSDSVLRRALSLLPDKLRKKSDQDVKTPGGQPVEEEGIGSGILAWLLGGGDTSPATGDDLDRYREAMTVRNIEGSFILQLSVRDRDPKFSADFANAIAEAYRLEAAKNNEDAIAELRADLSKSQTVIEFELDAARKERRGTASSAAAASEVDRLNRALDEQLSGLYTDRLQLDLWDSGSSNESLAAAMKLRVEAREKIIKQIRADLAVQQEAQAALAPIASNEEIAQKLLEDSRKRVLDLELAKNLGRTQVTILRRAYPPAEPDYPRPLQFGISAFVLSLLICAGVLFFLTALRSLRLVVGK